MKPDTGTAIGGDRQAVRPNRLAVPQEQLDNFQSRLARTRWPDEVPLEAELNAIPRRTLRQWPGRRPLPSALPPSRA